MFRSRSWFGGGWGRPKNPHSLEHLKYLYNVLARNHTVSEHNRGLLVESLRSIAEILIWGDQNDSSVFDFFLEKNMLSFFLRIMRQRSGGASYVCVQLLQTLNILFENIRNETSLYYLLSNNHVNSIIVHKFDFSDEEVMAYYISFLKTLSFKLNGHTIHFFYNEHTNDFPLYTEAIKFFNHRESMVRIAVRTLTLNVYRVEDASMLKFIRDKTAAPYFSNLVWFIGKHILELDACVRNDADHQSQQKLDDLVAEHLDHLHYLNDILCLNIPDLNQVLTEHLLHKLLIPLYIYSLTSNTAHRIRLANKRPLMNNTNSEQILHIETITRSLADILHQKGIDLGIQDTRQSSSRLDDYEEEQKPRVSCVVSLFLLSQVFLIITHGPLVHALAWVILHSNNSVFEEGATKILENYLKSKQSCIKLEFAKPSESLERALAISTSSGQRYKESDMEDSLESKEADEMPINGYLDREHFNDQSSSDMDPDLISNSVPSTSHTSEASSTRNNSSEDLIASDNDTVLNRSLLDQYHTTISERLQNVPDSPLPDSGMGSNTSGSVPDTNLNITDEEKEKIAQSSTNTPVVEHRTFNLVPERKPAAIETKPFLETILKSLDCSENDYIALFALCLLYALINNKGINQDVLDVILMPAVKPENDPGTSGSEPGMTTARPLYAAPLYSETLVDKLINIVQLSYQPPCRVRLVSLELSLKLLSQAAGGLRSPIPPVASGSGGQGNSGLTKGFTAAERRARAAEAARQQSASLVRNYYKSEELFLDMFEDEYCEMQKRPLNVEWLCMDAAILLPPTGTPMTGIAFTKRLPCGEVCGEYIPNQLPKMRRLAIVNHLAGLELSSGERARWAIRGYFLIRGLSLALNNETDTQLPLTNPLSYVQIGNVLDLNNSDLIACTIVLKDGQKSRRFMVIDPIQIILVEPEQKRLGWGVAKLVGNLQDLEVSGDKDDSRCLHLRIHRPPGGEGTSNRTTRTAPPLLQAKFVFDDHIRCMAAKQRLSKGRQRARQKKMQQIARLLELSHPPLGAGLGTTATARSGQRPEHRPLFTSSARVPGFAAALKKDTTPGAVTPRGKRIERQGDSSGGTSGNVTPPVPGYEHEAIGSYFSNSVRKGSNESSNRISIGDGKEQHHRSSGLSGSPGYRRQSPASGVLREHQSGTYRDRNRSKDSRGNRSRDGSPRMPRPRSEEIPLEPMSNTPEKSRTIITHSVPLVQERPHSPKMKQQDPDLSKACTSSGVDISCDTKPMLTPQISEETSFISQETVDSSKNKQRKRGSIETI